MYVSNDCELMINAMFITVYNSSFIWMLLKIKGKNIVLRNEPMYCTDIHIYTQIDWLHMSKIKRLARHLLLSLLC